MNLLTYSTYDEIVLENEVVLMPFYKLEEDTCIEQIYF